VTSGKLRTRGSAFHFPLLEPCPNLRLHPIKRGDLRPGFSPYNETVLQLQIAVQPTEARGQTLAFAPTLEQFWRSAMLVMAFMITSSLVAAQTATDSPAKIERRAILEFSYEPDQGILEARAFTPDGSNPFPLEKFEVSALADRLEQGKVEHTTVTRLDDSGFRAQLGLPQDTGWNLLFDVVAGGETLKGSYLLQVTTSTAQGKLALVRPPTEEISRLSLITSLLVGIPLGIAAIVVGLTLFRRAQVARAEP
jgi:hypothetical protein